MNRNETIKNIARILIFVILFQYISMIAPFVSINFATDAEGEWIDGTAEDGAVWEYQIVDGKAIDLKLKSYQYNEAFEEAIYYEYSGIEDTDGIYDFMLDIVKSNIKNIPEEISEEIETELRTNGVLRIPLQSVNVPGYIDGHEVVSFAGYGTSCVPEFIGKIEMSDNITTIEDDALQDFSNLRYIDLPSSLTSIGDSLFSTCQYLREIKIPKNVKSIDCSQFNTWIESIEVDEENPYYKSKDGVLFNKEMTELIRYTFREEETYIIPSSVQQIHNGAFPFFRGEEKKRVVIPSSVTDVGNDFSHNETCDFYKIVYVEGSTILDKINDNVELEVLHKIKFEDENLFNAIVDKCKDYLVEQYPDTLKLVVDKGITTLDISNCGIKSLVGLENFTDLEELNVSGNKIADFEPIENLKKLQNVNLENQIIEVEDSFSAIRKGSKVYIYSDSDKVFYSFSGDEEAVFTEYTEPIENEDATTIFLKAEENSQVKEITIQKEIESKNGIYDINDIKRATYNKDNNHIYREKSGIVMVPKGIYDLRFFDLYISFNKKDWIGTQELNTYGDNFGIENQDADTIYIKLVKNSNFDGFEFLYKIDDKFRIFEGNIVIEDYIIRNIAEKEEGQFIGVYNEEDTSYLFGKKQEYSKEDNQYDITSDYNNIQQIKNGKIIDITTIMGDTLVLKQDGNVYKLGDSYNSFIEISEEKNFTHIAGKFAVDVNNEIWIVEYNNSYNTYSYRKATAEGYTTRGKKVEKILSVMLNESRPYVLYTDGKAEILLPQGETNFIAENVIDIAANDDILYAMQEEKVICKDSWGEEQVSISKLIQKNEEPVRINKFGTILTNNGNYYEMTLYYTNSDGERLSVLNSDKKIYLESLSSEEAFNTYNETININRQYLLDTPQKTDILKLGDYTYQKNNKEIYYIKNEKNDIKANNKVDKGLTLTKDESKLNENKVIINVEATNNVISIKRPDGKITQDKNFTYEVTKNGEYVFEYTDSDGNTGIKLVHVQTIQNRKETKVPKVTALNGKIRLESDDEIEYSLDNNNWNEYTQEITYESPVYARVKDEKYECSVLKITIDEYGHLDIQNTEDRKIQDEILTNGIGMKEKLYSDGGRSGEYIKNINYQNGVENKETTTETEENKNLFQYISQIADNIIYTFSSTDGKYAGCFFEQSASEITYKEMDNTISNIAGENYNLNNNNSIEYSVITEENKTVWADNSTEEKEKKKVEDGEIYSYTREIYYGSSAEGEIYWIERILKYAYIDTQGNLVSNIDIINKAKEVIEKKNKNIKYTKIIGDGVTFYILTELGEVYIATSGENGTWEYLTENYDLNHESWQSLEYMNEYSDTENINIISRLNLTNIVNIYDSATALTKEGKIVSLIEDNEESSSIVQELQSQTDKYLMVSHLGLKDGKLYNFDDVKKGEEVTTGKFIESDEAKYGVYIEETKTIRLFNKYDKYRYHQGGIYIDVQKTNDTLPKFIDIAEYRDSCMCILATFSRGYRDRNVYDEYANYLNTDQYALCYAISEDGEIWAYIGGCVIDTGLNLDFFGPTTNYTLSNSNWTNQDIDLVYTENTTNKIQSRKVKKGDETISEESEVSIEKNGVYNIEIEDSKNRRYQTTLNVVNIDKIKPVVKAEGKVENEEVTLKAQDIEDTTGNYGISGISKIKVATEYPSENTTWTELEGTLDESGVWTGKVEGIKYNMKLYAVAIDNAGNESDITEIEAPEEPERKLVHLVKKVAGKTESVNLEAAKKDDVLVYSVVVTNKGNTTITSVKITDEFLNIKDKEYTFNSLKPGESTEIELGEYTVTQEDIDKQQPIKNVVTAEDGDEPSEIETPVEIIPEPEPEPEPAPAPEPAPEPEPEPEPEPAPEKVITIEDKIATILPYTGLRSTTVAIIIGALVSIIGAVYCVKVYKRN